MNADTPAVVADPRCRTGEGPLYHEEAGSVYWVDIPRGHLYRYDLITDDYERVLDVNGAIGGFTIQADGDLLLFCDEGRIVPWNPESGLGDPVVESVAGEADSRFNDVVADPHGRVYAGTMPVTDRDGSLYRLDTDGTLATVETGLAIPNGMGFTSDREAMYLTETDADRIYRYDYDEETGTLSDRAVFVDTADVEGKPDGLTVDAEGSVWSAFWDGGRLTRYAPDGSQAERVPFPARKVSSVTFGGPDYEIAYVTTALGPGEGQPGTREAEGPGAGTLFAVDLEVTGVPEFRSRVALD